MYVCSIHFGTGSAAVTPFSGLGKSHAVPAGASELAKVDVQHGLAKLQLEQSSKDTLETFTLDSVWQHFVQQEGSEQARFQG